MSHTYTYAGGYPRALFGLSVGVNAEIVKADGTVPPVGSTVEVAPGDRVTTTDPYPHPDLHETDAAPAAPAAPEAPAPEPAAAEPAPAVVADPATPIEHTDAPVA